MRGDGSDARRTPRRRFWRRGRERWRDRSPLCAESLHVVTAHVSSTVSGVRMQTAAPGGRTGSPARDVQPAVRTASSCSTALDPLGEHLDVELAPDGDDAAQQCGGGAAPSVRARRRQVADEAPVDLDAVDGQLVQPAERREAGAEVVERDPHAEVAQGDEPLDDARQVEQRPALDQLEVQAGTVPACASTSAVRTASCSRGSPSVRVDRLTAMCAGPSGPSGQVAACTAGLAQHPAGRCRRWRRRARPPGRRRRGPAGRGRGCSQRDERLGADDAVQPVVGEAPRPAAGACGSSPVGRSPAAGRRRAGGPRRRGTHPPSTPPIWLRPRRLATYIAASASCEQQVAVAVAAVLSATPTLHGQPELATVDAHGLLEAGGDALGDLDRERRLVDAGQQDRELVAAQAGDGVPGTHRVGEPGRHLAQHLVAGAVPVGVVDLLEPVEVAEQHRAPPPRRAVCSALARRSRNRLRFGRPVSASCSAWWLHVLDEPGVLQRGRGVVGDALQPCRSPRPARSPRAGARPTTP